MKRPDYFSRQSRLYAAFRPTYPEELYQFIYQHVGENTCAWDCATGNGQVAAALARHFAQVYATDISTDQLRHAFTAPNIHYSVAPAEKCPFDDNMFDLITVGQALHWFDRDKFYDEVRRAGKPHSLLAVWGYDLPQMEPAINDVLLDFYRNTVGPYWDEARVLVERHYRDSPFPFEVIPAPSFSIKLHWTADDLAGYVSSWSATQRYILEHNTDPVVRFREQLQSLWKPDEVKDITYPIFMKLGRVYKPG